MGGAEAACAGWGGLLERGESLAAASFQEKSHSGLEKLIPAWL
jgi:hypothetical protein